MRGPNMAEILQFRRDIDTTPLEHGADIGLHESNLRSVEEARLEIQKALVSASKLDIHEMSQKERDEATARASARMIIVYREEEQGAAA